MFKSTKMTQKYDFGVYFNLFYQKKNFGAKNMFKCSKWLKGKIWTYSDLFYQIKSTMHSRIKQKKPPFELKKCTNAQKWFKSMILAYSVMFYLKNTFWSQNVNKHTKMTQKHDFGVFRHVLPKKHFLVSKREQTHENDSKARFVFLF